MSDEQNNAPRPGALPVYVSDGENTVRADHDMQIATPTGAEIGRFGDARRTTCGTCKAWKHQAGQEAISRQKFVQRLVIEEGWKTRHLGAPIETFGLCGQSDGSTICSSFTQSCDQYQPRNGAIREAGDWHK